MNNVEVCVVDDPAGKRKRIILNWGNDALFSFWLTVDESDAWRREAEMHLSVFRKMYEQGK